MSEAHEEIRRSEDTDHSGVETGEKLDSDLQKVESLTEAIGNLDVGDGSTNTGNAGKEEEGREEKKEELEVHKVHDEHTSHHHHSEKTDHHEEKQVKEEENIESSGSTKHELHSEEHTEKVEHHKEVSEHVHHEVHVRTEDMELDKPSLGAVEEAEHAGGKIEEAAHSSPDHHKDYIPAKSNIKDTYTSILESPIDIDNEFLTPFHATLRKHGKFHQTLLFNYLSTSGDFISQDTLSLNGKELKPEKFNWTSRSLQVGKTLLLFTGGSSSYRGSFTLDVESESINELAKLNHGRDLHAMAWIDSKVAVIGGCDENQEPLASVEIFEESWSTAAPLNHARYGHSATFHLNRTWVFGGAKAKNNAVDTVEYYENDAWTVLAVKLPVRIVGAGLVGVKSAILVLGGFGENKENSKLVWRFDTKKARFERIDELDHPASFSQNLWRIDGENLEGHGFRGKRISYSY